MTDPQDLDPLNPLGPEPSGTPAGANQSPRHPGAPAQTLTGDTRRTSRVDTEVERLRRSPTPDRKSVV